MAEDGEAVAEGYGNQYGDAPKCPVVLEEHCVPESVRRIDNTPLCNTRIKIIHIIINHVPANKSTVKGIRNKTCLGAAAGAVVWPVYQEKVIFSIYFIYM